MKDQLINFNLLTVNDAQFSSLVNYVINSIIAENRLPSLLRVINNDNIITSIGGEDCWEITKRKSAYPLQETNSWPCDAAYCIAMPQDIIYFDTPIVYYSEIQFRSCIIKLVNYHILNNHSFASQGDTFLSQLANLPF